MNLDKGFILTRHARDINGSTQIELWLNTDSGPTQIKIQGERVLFFIKQEDLANVESLCGHLNFHVEFKSLSLLDFEQNRIVACYCPTQHISNQLIAQCKAKGVDTIEADIRLTERYLMERFIRGSVEFTGVFRNRSAPSKQNDNQNHHSYVEVTQAKCRKGDFQPKLSYVSLDIECSQTGELYSVGLASTLDNRVIMIGSPEPCSTPVQWVENEKQLLIALIEWFSRYDPDLILGWMVIDFDFKLLVRRAEVHGLKLSIGRANQNAYFRVSSKTQQGFISIPGRVVLDGIDTLKSATYSFRSWALESVSQQLLSEGKAIHNVHDRMAEINHMFKHDKPALAKYNLQDCVLVNRIFEHTQLIDFVVERSRLTGVELDRMGGSVAAFTNLYLPQLHRAGYVAPNLHADNWQPSPGGYVMDSLPGLYNSVLVLDYKSLYPSIIRSFLIDPLGLIEGLKIEVGAKDNQAVEGYVGGQFHRSQHFLPKMISDLWTARDSAKRNNNKAFSQAIKIIMNSFYGVLGSAGCRFFDVRLASSITMRGHEIMKKTKQLVEEKGYYVIYGDTDSTFISLQQALPHSEANKIGKQLVDYINSWWTTHLQDHYGLTSCLEIEYETHYRKFLMPTIRGSETGSKKRYAGLIGEDTNEQIIFKGLESARTDWTTLSQEFQLELYKLVFHGADPCEYIRQYVEATMNGDFDHKLIYQKRLRRKLSDYQKNIPPQVKAARLADEINTKLGRPLQYQNRGRIEYIITLNGPEPAEYLKSTIDYQHYINKQLRPVADAILPFIGLDFDSINAPQLGLF
ncbi:DNA polymerase II [Vibrio sp. TH_r3]|uniref:DNA polymerase II n=1 Tax=Vibrio sp. TH_r3 TaxID=3082084 RepID=UPI0029542185|nr:DNA polymerase II [Vibrio sp. TH_r3]MDV7102938.1 DNA polymerase II [Vibrio sp. TH_r3]